jgi:hypothetical protein
VIEEEVEGDAVEPDAVQAVGNALGNAVREGELVVE